ncbi:expressed unknown protein [Seminavis robusta]|uniref:Uncharacterized protein n=1 Tax=Seminavis robusta TaxID=568900 RepID=A0A9N8DDG0_9STRA|nr:expressed unknown protein [Seminavis robusta]|eukprot:Sro23_g015880.1 n/a (635) ;mRNA; r:94632-96770
MPPDRRPPTRRRRKKKKTTARPKLAYLKDFCKEDDEFKIDLEGFQGDSVDNLQEEPLKKTPQQQQPQPVHVSVLQLLFQRELGGRRASSMIVKSLQADNNHYCKPRKGYRSFAQRSMPFSKLRTPPSDAILAIDRYGAYAVALSDMTFGGQEQPSDDNDTPALALRFYGIPSPANLKGIRSLGDSRQGTLPATAPLLQTVPLLPSDQRGSREVLVQSMVVSARADFIVSSDWKVGVAFVRKRPNPGRRQQQQHQQQGNVVIFSLPGNSSSNNIQTLACSEASAKCHTMRSLMWAVHQIPYNARENHMPNHESSICDSILDHPGYLLFILEGTGFRLTWIDVDRWNRDVEDACVKPVLPLPHLTTSHDNRRNNNVIMDSISNSDEWKQQGFDNTYKGTDDGVSGSNNTNGGGLRVAFEARLNVKVLLGEVLMSYNMTQAFSDEDDGVLPEHHFSFNIQSVNDGGRSANLVVVFKSKNSEDMGMRGVFITLDVFTQHYRVTGWVENKAAANNQPSLQRQCNALTLSRRMRERRLGPYSVRPNDRKDYGYLCEERPTFDFEMERDISPAEWEPFCEMMDQARKESNGGGGGVGVKSKIIPFASLYPHCDFFTNRTLLTAQPSPVLIGRKSPLKLVYC